jgi:hypothetical protein
MIAIEDAASQHTSAGGALTWVQLGAQYGLSGEAIRSRVRRWKAKDGNGGKIPLLRRAG